MDTIPSAGNASSRMAPLRRRRSCRGTDTRIDVASFENIASLASPSIAALSAQHATVEALIASGSIPNLEVDLSTHRLLGALAMPEALAAAGQLSESFADAFLQAQLAFEQDLVEPRLAQLSDVSDAVLRNQALVIQEASKLASVINVGMVFAALDSPDPSSLSLPPDWRRTNFYSELHSELELSLDLEDTELDIQTRVRTTRPSRASSEAYRLLKLVRAFNKRDVRNGKPETFKPTIELAWGFAVTTHEVATDEESFANVVDSLFHIMYEGTGNAQRFVETYGREDPRLNWLWDLKHLRHEIRHDIDHGDSLETRRKHLRVGRIFESLIGRRFPQTSEDWLTAQIEIYRSLRRMLDAFWSESPGDGRAPRDGDG